MLNRDAAEKIMALMQNVGAELKEAAGLIEENSDDDDHETYLSTIEYVIGYLQQDVMQPVISDYPDLAPDDWS